MQCATDTNCTEAGLQSSGAVLSCHAPTRAYKPAASRCDTYADNAVHDHVGTGGGGDTGSWVDFGAPEPPQPQQQRQGQGQPPALLPGAAFGAAAGAAAGAAVGATPKDAEHVPPTSLAAAGVGCSLSINCAPRAGLYLQYARENLLPRLQQASQLDCFENPVLGSLVFRFPRSQM